MAYYLDGLCCESCEAGDPCDCSPGLSGLGLDVGAFDNIDLSQDFVSQPMGELGGISTTNLTNLVAQAAAFVPVVGPIASTALTTFTQLSSAINKWFGLGAGRREADIITPSQNQVAAILGQIDTATQMTNNVPALQHLYQVALEVRDQWLRFISDRTKFSDGRASQQSANDIMPQIDGTCGYTWPQMTPTRSAGCTAFGVPQVGRLAPIRAKILQYGGAVSGPMLQQGAGVPNLEYPFMSDPLQIPQSGWLSPIKAPTYPGIVSIGGSNLSMGVGILGALAIFMLYRGKRI